MENATKAHRFINNYPATADKIFNITNDNNFIAKIADNLPLFNVYNRSGCTKFVRLLDALDQIQQDSVLIYFAELDMYGLFTPETYVHFCTNICDKIEDDKIQVHPYQIVLSGHKQKLVFACADSEYFDKILRYSEECFGKQVSIVRDKRAEITVDVTADSEYELVNLYETLYDYVYKKDRACSEVMEQLRIFREREYRFRRANLSNSLDKKAIDELKQVLKNIPAGITINQLNVIIGNNNVFNNTPVDKHVTAKKWVKNNPPREKEITTDYYNRYQQFNSDCIHNNQFGKIVRDEGYETIQGRKGRYWKK